MIIEIKEGNRTIYRSVPDNGDQSGYEERTGKDLTTGGAKSLFIEMSKEEHAKIFKKDNKNQ